MVSTVCNDPLQPLNPVGFEFQRLDCVQDMLGKDGALRFGHGGRDGFELVGELRVEHALVEELIPVFVQHGAECGNVFRCNAKLGGVVRSGGGGRRVECVEEDGFFEFDCLPALFGGEQTRTARGFAFVGAEVRRADGAKARIVRVA